VRSLPKKSKRFSRKREKESERRTKKKYKQKLLRVKPPRVERTTKERKTLKTPRLLSNTRKRSMKRGSFLSQTSTSITRLRASFNTLRVIESFL
jgi:hypothetical protein